MANWRLTHKTPTTDQAQTPPDPMPGLIHQAHEVADTIHDLDQRTIAARSLQYRLIRQMIAAGTTWDQVQQIAQTSRTVVMRAVREGKKLEAEAGAAMLAQHDAERDAFYQALGEDPGLTPRP